MTPTWLASAPKTQRVYRPPSCCHPLKELPAAADAPPFRRRREKQASGRGTPGFATAAEAVLTRSARGLVFSVGLVLGGLLPAALGGVRAKRR